jgi:hypothetical protein
MEGEMPLQEMYYIAEMVVGVAVIISIIFVAIELRQNTYMTKKSSADQREARYDWLHRSLILDDEFFEFQQRVVFSWDSLEDDEKVRATMLGVQMITPMLNELVAYFSNQLSEDEFRILNRSIKLVSKRPHCLRAFNFLKPGYSDQVQNYWLKAIDSDQRGVSLREVALA